MHGEIGIILIIFLLTIILVVVFRYRNKMTGKLNKPKYKTVVMYEEFKEYICKSKENEEDLDELYKKIIVDSVYQDFIYGGEYAFLANAYIGRTIRQLDDLENKLRLLYKEKAEKIVEAALKKSHDYLPGVDTTVYIFPSTNEYLYLTSSLGGVAGCTLGSGKILVLIDPTASNWEHLLLYIIAHEYHHSIWTARELCKNTFTLLDYLVFEGRADSFASRIYPDVDVPWISSISFEVEKFIWCRINNQLNNKDNELLHKVMFGGVEDFPLWSGYTIGYHIVQDFLKNNPEVSIGKWTKMDSSEILEKSRYWERFR